MVNGIERGWMAHFNYLRMLSRPPEFHDPMEQISSCSKLVDGLESSLYAYVYAKQSCQQSIKWGSDSSDWID